MKKKFLLSACLALSLVLAGCSGGGNSTIKGSGSVEGVSLTQDTFNVDIGETYFLKSFVQFSPANPKDNSYTLESSNETVFTVNSDEGSFTGVSVGVGTLTLTTNDGGYTAAARVVVGGGIQEDVPDDAGDSSITYSNYTLVFTIYDEDAEVQQALNGDTLYITGDYDGTWNPDGWYDWGGYTALTQTIDQAGNVAYSITLSSVTGGSHEFMICYGSATWNPIRSDNFTFTIATTALDNGTHYYNLINCYNFDNKFGEGDDDAPETSFYILFVDSGTYSNTASHTVNAGKSVFNGSTTCTGTNATTGNGKACIYNSVVATLKSGDTDWYWIWEQNGLDFSTGTITIPTNTSGYAVYKVEYDFAANSSHQEDNTAGSWATGIASITDYIATL